VVNYLHDQRAAESIIEAILAGNGDAVAVRADIADDLDVNRLFAETIAAFGGIDVVVHPRRQPDHRVCSNQGQPGRVRRTGPDQHAGHLRRQPGGSPAPSQRRRDRQSDQLSR